MVQITYLKKGKRITYSADSNIGVYGIFCDATNRVYIGQSKNVYGRLRSHKMQLKKQSYIKHSQLLREMQTDWNVHGEKAFRFEQLAECKEEQLLSLETQYCIKYYKEGLKLYNTFIHTENSGVTCPEIYVKIVTRVIQMLDKGQLTIEGLERGLDSL